MKFFLYLTATVLSLGLSYQSQAQQITIDKQTFRFGGYTKTGIGSSQGGVTQADFKAPGAQSKYRLGNEANNYLEYQLSYEYMLNREKGKSFEFVYMGSGYSEFEKTSQFAINDINQLYVKMNNLYNNIDVWLGRRYYYRKSIQILDHWWLNPDSQAQGAIGVEGLRRKDKSDDIKIALFKYEDPKAKAFNPKIDSAKEGTLNSYKLDARWVDIPVNKGGTLNFVVDYSVRAARKDLGFDSKNGFGLGLWHEQKDLFGGKVKNTFAVLYRKGTSIIHQHTYSGVANRENELSSQYDIGYNLDKAYSFEVNNNAFIEYDKQFSLEGNLMYHIENQGVIPYNYRTGKKIVIGDNVQWFSTGFRYLYYLHKHLNLALEVGADYVDNKTVTNMRHVTGWLTKITFSPQISWNYGYWSRPVIRPFITYAFWDKSMKRLVGNTPYSNRTDGFTFGAQLEIWW
ncbi:MAG: carbohydrate porin [Flavobacteriales bacterium AspAUS03]